MKTILLTSAFLLTVTLGLKAENNQKEQKSQETNELKDEKKKTRLYSWEIKTQNGYAKGVSTSEEHANKMIAAFNKGDNLDFKLITSKKIN